jgi:hypothetical protein
MERDMAWELHCFKTAEYSRANGDSIRNMEKAISSSPAEIITKDNTFKANPKALESIIGKTVRFMMVSGSMA